MLCCLRSKRKKNKKIPHDRGDDDLSKPVMRQDGTEENANGLANIDDARDGVKKSEKSGRRHMKADRKVHQDAEDGDHDDLKGYLEDRVGHKERAC